MAEIVNRVNRCGHCNGTGVVPMNEKEIALYLELKPENRYIHQHLERVCPMCIEYSIEANAITGL